MSWVCRWICVVMVAGVFNLPCRAETPEAVIMGAWTNADARLLFYGQGIGRECAAGVSRYFQYACPSDETIRCSYGGGDSITRSLVVTNDELRWAVEGEEEVVFAKAGGFTNACAVNLRRLEGAITLYTLDHGETGPIMMDDLIPDYLQAAPSCPEGGSYVLWPQPMCNQVGHLPGSDD